VNLRFAGQYADSESNLFQNGYRSYAPAIGSYSQMDPIGLGGGMNRRGYVGGDTFGYSDPEGLAACTVLFPDYPIEYSPGKTSTLLGGHGGVLTYDAKGSTEYYEYGRYAPNQAGVFGQTLPADEGNVRRRGVPDLVMDKDGNPTPASVEALRQSLSDKSGKGTRADLTCDASIDEKKVAAYAQSIAADAKRPKYSWKPWSSNQCRTFSRNAFNAGK
jgi:RHS repeat-associated protein